MSLKKIIQNKWHYLMRWLKKPTITFLSALGADIEKAGGDFLIQTALDAVRIAEDKGGSGADKFSAALSYVKSTLKSKGLPIVVHAVNGAIEAAVAQIKAQ